MLARSLPRTLSRLMATKTINSVCVRGFASDLLNKPELPKIDADIETLSVKIHPPKGVKADSSIIMLHGVGDTGFFMAPYAVDLALTFPKTNFICPTAPVIGLTCRDGAQHHAWYNFPSWDLDGNNKCTGVEKSCERVERLIKQEMQKGIKSENIFLCGYSQGAGIAIQTAYNCGIKVGGLIVYCGCLPNDRTFKVNPNNKDVPSIFFHGTADNHVPYEFMKHIPELLNAHGVTNVQFCTYPGVKHHITKRMLELTKDFVNEHLSKN